MPDSPTYSKHQSGDQRFRADLVAYLDSLPMGKLVVMTRVTLMHELSDRGPAWARVPATRPQHPDAEHMGRRSLRESSRTGVPPAPPAVPAHRHRSAGPLATGGWPSRLPAGGAPVRSPSGGWPRRYAAQPRPA
jgi:hypothetical protein